MREIFFRGKTDKGEWEYGDLLIKGFDFETAIRKLYEYKSMLLSSVIKVIPETVGQYTGLTDKNGKKIFEGDIVEYKEEYGEIAYDDEQAMFNVLFDTWCTDFDHIYPYELEVIGNIHDKPELLKGEQ